MSRMNRVLVLLAAFAVCTGLQAAPAMKAQTNNVDAVAVKATPLKVEGAVWEIEVVFDTHSQDLSDDMQNAAVLVSPDGSTVKPVTWNGDAPGGHHRKGVLRFKALNPPPDVLELRIMRAKESKPRIFRWPMTRQ